MSLALDIETSIDFVILRTEKTRAAQAAAAATWVWPVKTLALWDADLAQTEAGTTGTLAQVAARDHVLYENSRGLLDGRYETMKARTKQAVLLMRGQAVRNPALAPAVDELTAKATSWTAIEKEAEECLAVWTTTFGGATYTPAPGNTYASFKALFEGDAAAVPPVPTLRALKTPHGETLAVARTSTGLFNALLTRLEDQCVQWYADATAVFPEGTPLGDMIRATVPTSDNYNPPSIALPGAPDNPSVTSGATDSGEVIFNWEPRPAGENVTLHNIYSGSVPVATAVAPPATVGGFTSGDTVTLTVTAINLAGEGPPSEPASGTAG